MAGVASGAKTVFFMLIAIVFCILAYLVLSVIAGQSSYREPTQHTNYCVVLPHRLIGSH